MFRVLWCNNEGNLQERIFENLQDALTEALELQEKFGDPVEVLGQDRRPVEL